MSKKLKIKKGLTLLELIVVLGLMSIITMLVFSFVDLTQKKSSELDVKQQLQHEGTMITENLMNNVLPTNKIYSIELDTENNIKNISFDFDGNYTVKLDSGNIEVDKLMYERENNKLILKGHIIHGSEDDIECIDDRHLTDIQIVSEYIDIFKIENKNIVELGNPIPVDKLGEAIKNEKGINLKLILSDEYQGEKILHEHIIELNFRNAK